MARIRYLNTDLDLRADEDLRPLTRALERRGLIALQVGPEKDSQWFACLEVDEWGVRSPNRHIAAVLHAVAGLPAKPQALWNRCRLRELNLGYASGDTPRSVHHGIQHRLLKRIVDLRLSLRITVYPPLPEEDRFGNG